MRLSDLGEAYAGRRMRMHYAADVGAGGVRSSVIDGKVLAGSGTPNSELWILQSGAGDQHKDCVRNRAHRCCSARRIRSSVAGCVLRY